MRKPAQRKSSEGRFTFDLFLDTETVIDIGKHDGKNFVGLSLTGLKPKTWYSVTVLIKEMVLPRSQKPALAGKS